MSAAASTPTPPQTILLVDDEQDLLDLVSYNLEKEGYEVVTARDGETALEHAETHDPDLVVLDVMMPNMTGIEVCRRLRENAKLRLTPILMLTARGEESDEIKGLEAGADDYLAKPISPRLLLSRIRALLRRGEREETASTTQLRVHDLHIDRSRYVVTRHEGLDGEETFRMPRKEFELLYVLAAHPGRVFSREELLDGVWGPNVYVVDRTVDVHVRKVREKIGSDYIETVKGVGYKLREEM
ncbi:MAG: response regulator transcription factor [Bacteroidota bacterium]